MQTGVALRQTTAIFKQPVTVYKTQESKTKSDFMQEIFQKPNQLFWTKRLDVIDYMTVVLRNHHF